MKYLLYICILLAAVLVPDKGMDVGKLIPVEVVMISEDRGSITLHTDTGDSGIGNTLDAAISDLKAGASGVIYLDTAEYLLLENGMENQLNAIGRHLKGVVRLCHASEGISLEAVADFLSVHRPEVTLKTVSDYSAIPIIWEENGRYRLTEK